MYLIACKSYENFEGNTIQFLGLQEKDIFRAFWLFFASTKHETCNPKCMSHVHEIIMPRMCQSVYKRLFKIFLQFWI